MEIHRLSARLRERRRKPGDFLARRRRILRAFAKTRKRAGCDAIAHRLRKVFASIERRHDGRRAGVARAHRVDGVDALCRLLGKLAPPGVYRSARAARNDHGALVRGEAPAT
jgi:hypothetical protein